MQGQANGFWIRRVTVDTRTVSVYHTPFSCTRRRLKMIDCLRTRSKSSSLVYLDTMVSVDAYGRESFLYRAFLFDICCVHKIVQ